MATVATRHALSDLSLLKLCPVTPGALFLLLTPSARLLTELWRRRFMSLDKGKQPQPISFFSSLPHIWLDEIFTIFGWLPHLFFVRMQCSPLYCFLDSWRVCLCFISGRTVGRAAFSGNHQWIVHGTANGHGLSSEVRTVLECFPSEFWSEINANPISVLSGSILLPPHLKHCGG